MTNVYLTRKTYMCILSIDVVEAHVTATDFLWGIWAIHIAKKKLMVGRFDHKGLN